MQKVEFIEAAYQAFIEFDLRQSFYLADQRFVINTYAGSNERSRGYDLEALALVPLFLQLKVSDFYPAFSRSKLQAARSKGGVVDNPGFYAFSLHPDRKSATYKQHNLLAALHAGGSYARYIAPLFHLSSDLERLKYSFRDPYWGCSPAGLRDRHMYYWRDYLSFDHSISILPHRPVLDPRTVPHKYTYSLKRHVCFHSEVERTQDGERFMESVYDELTRVADEEPLSLAAINTRIREALAQVEVGAGLPVQGAAGQTETVHFRILARYLMRSFNIACVLVSARA